MHGCCWLAVPLTALSVLAPGLAMAADTGAPAPLSATVAIGSLDRKNLPAASQYILQSTVLEQLRSRSVQTLDAARAPYVYLARVGVERRETGCVYRVVVSLVPNTVLTAADSQRPSLWGRDFTSEGMVCDEVNAAMTRTLDRLAEAFAHDLAAGKVRATDATTSTTPAAVPAPR